jgi:phage terminase large subunit GpA-like protein
MTPAAEALRDHLRAIYAPIDRRTVTQWCEDEIILSERQTQSPGNFSCRLTPYLREPLECFGDVDVTDLVLVFGTQTGKTTMVQAGSAWRIANKPQPVVWVMPTEGLARSFSETRWLPLFQDSATLRDLIPADRHKFKNLEQHFPRCSLVFVGSNSPANLASRPAGLLLMDEVDKFARETDQETSALFLAENRTKSFVGALRVKTSTPTTPDGAIWQEYQKGTQEKFLLPCPHCQAEIELLWEQVRWDQDAKQEDGRWNMARVESTAHYACQSCNAPINDGQKMEMLPAGVWRSTNPAAQRGFRSFHLNSLYAPWRSCTFGALAVKFLRDKDTINGLQDFTNSTMAMPWEQVQTSVGEADVLALRGDYRRGSCPIEPEVVLFGADIGLERQHWVTTAFDQAGNATVLDFGTVLAIEDLAEPLTRTYTTPAGHQAQPLVGLIDSGYSTYRVYHFCASVHPRLHPAKGSQAMTGRRPITMTPLDEFPGLGLYTYIDHLLKDELYQTRIKERKMGLQIPLDCDHEFLRSLGGQMKVPRRTASGVELVWKKLAADHYGDALKLTIVAWRELAKK